MNPISIKKKGKEWIATRESVKGYGKTKKKAIADLEETERFLKIADDLKGCPYVRPEKAKLSYKP